MRNLLSLDRTRSSPLLKGPYVSLSRPFRDGAAVPSLVDEGLLHPHLRERIPNNITHLRSHQVLAIRAIAERSRGSCLLTQERTPPHFLTAACLRSSRKRIRTLRCGRRIARCPATSCHKATGQLLSTLHVAERTGVPAQ